jgi:hypothetical protein
MGWESYAFSTGYVVESEEKLPCRRGAAGDGYLGSAIGLQPVAVEA